MKLAIKGGKKSIAKVFSKYNSIGEEELNAVSEVIKSGVLSKYLGAWHEDFYGGPKVREFEDQAASFFDVKHAITVNSWTSGLVAAVGAIDISPGDEVIVTPWTMSASATAILHWNAIPIFADIDPKTYNLDPQSIEKNITSKTKAILVADIFGLSADMNKINEIASKYNLKVIEDAAQSFGGSIRGKKVGTFGDVAATSFYPAKPLGCYGDGGAIFTNDDNLAEECKAIRIHGTKQDKYNSEMIGLNGRLDSIQAAVLLEKLSIFDDELVMRNEVDFHYRKYINNAQHHPEGYQSAHALFSIVLGSSIKRDNLIDRLTQNKVPSVIYYKFPIHLMEAFQYLGYRKGSLPISENLSHSIVSLPMHPYLTEADIDFIVNTIQTK